MEQLLESAQECQGGLEASGQESWRPDWSEVTEASVGGTHELRVKLEEQEL